MDERIKHYGWKVSPYSAKTRSYLRYAGVPFDDVAPTMLELLGPIRRAVGAVVMPTVRLPGGRFIKDSSNIIDHFAHEPHATSIEPGGPRQRVASAVLEVYGDEWLPLATLHYRWSRKASADFAVAEFGRAAAPWLPAFVQRAIGRGIATKMQSYLPMLGIDARSAPGIETMTRALIADLEDLLLGRPYLLGHRPCLGDFSLYGPLFGHLSRDPGSTELFAQAPRVRGWLERMHAPQCLGEFDVNDAIPAPLERILARAFAEQWSYLKGLVGLIDAYAAAHPEAKRVPRALGQLPFTVGGVTAERKAVTFAQWKQQRATDCFAALGVEEQAEVRAWLERLGGVSVCEPPRHPFCFVGHALRLAR